MLLNQNVSRNLFLIAILLFGHAGIFSSCSSDDNSASEPGMAPATHHHLWSGGLLRHRIEKRERLTSQRDRHRVRQTNIFATNLDKSK